MVILMIKILPIFIFLTSCLIVQKDNKETIKLGLKNEKLYINSLDNYFAINHKYIKRKSKQELGLDEYYKINPSKIKLGNEYDRRWVQSRIKPYFNQQKYILHFLTRPSWEIEFYNPESSPKPNYHLVYFSDVSDREKCSNYLSKKYKPIEDWYYTNKFWSLKKCLGIDK